MKMYWQMSVLALLFLVIGLSGQIVSAKSEAYNPQIKTYMSPLENGFATNSLTPVMSPILQKDTIGELFVTGEINTKKDYSGVEALGVMEPITIGYSYDGSYLKTGKEEWHICSSEEKSIRDSELKKKVQKGVLLVQKSSDMIDWQNATEPLYDFFDKNKQGKTDIYTISEAEMVEGCFYRIVVAYKLGRKTGTESVGPFGAIKKDIFEYVNILEESTFYICSDRKDIVPVNISDKSKIENNSSVESGFYIKRFGSSADVTVSKKNKIFPNVSEYQPFTEAGDYVIKVTNKIGNFYEYIILSLTLEE